MEMTMGKKNVDRRTTQGQAKKEKAAKRKDDAATNEVDKRSVKASTEELSGKDYARAKKLHVELVKLRSG
jgi:hypothetical protein